MDHFPGFIKIKQGCTKTVDKAITGCQYAVIKQQPTFTCLNGNRSGSDLGALPACAYTHLLPMLTPVDQIQALTEKNIAEGCMAVVTRAIEKHIFTLDFPGKLHAIAIERQ